MFDDEEPTILMPLKRDELTLIRLHFRDVVKHADAGNIASAGVSIQRAEDALSVVLDRLDDLRNNRADRQHPDAIEEYDDGSAVYLLGTTGGAHPLGLWGECTFEFVAADGSRTQRTYRATDIAKDSAE